LTEKRKSTITTNDNKIEKMVKEVEEEDENKLRENVILKEKMI